MQIIDIINGTFETLGGLAVGLSIRQLLRDRRVAGYHWGSLVYFTSWGYWNIYYYPALDQWVSAVGATMTALANTVYLGMIIYFSRKGNDYAALEGVARRESQARQAKAPTLCSGEASARYDTGADCDAWLP
jgi:hypothetical protein